MLKFAIESETDTLGCDPDTEEVIDTVLHFVTATDDTGHKWRNCESFATLFESVNEVGEAVYSKNRQAHNDAKGLMREFVAAELTTVETLEDWSEE